ncbi:extracellular matrix-binding protein ebh isoform X2 [Drosophila simulans]|uniref:extracellular matrix-binding protein ebh isoform X2 n=1 Tax=Drosophila simulans TaxID=7240 RepID=UPI00192CF1BC|nr:extracellular matrix-binding protein ebh isoform X2 [Drosophila simulans]
MTTASLPRVPEGLRDLMKVYTKEVLREKPADLYGFSASFFNMIVGEKSHQSVRKYEPVQTYETIMKNRIRQQVPLSMVFNIIPEKLTDLIKQFIKAVLREKPDNIYIFAQEYFQRMSKEKSGRIEYSKYSSYEKSLKDKGNLTPATKVTCECGRVLSANRKDVENTASVYTDNKLAEADQREFSSRITYIQSVVIIQRHFRRYLNERKIGREKDKCNSVEYVAAILLIQRQVRRHLAKKRVEKLKNSHDAQKSDAKPKAADYMKAVVVIQRHYRIYLKRKEEQNRLKHGPVSLATAAIIIQRAYRRMVARHRAKRTTSTVTDQAEELNDNASETGSYTSVSTALLSTESTELGMANFEERVHQKIIHEDEEVENSNVDAGLEKEYFAEAIKGEQKSINLRKSEILSGALIESMICKPDSQNIKDLNNESKEFDVELENEHQPAKLEEHITEEKRTTEDSEPEFIVDNKTSLDLVTIPQVEVKAENKSIDHQSSEDQLKSNKTSLDTELETHEDSKDKPLANDLDPKTDDANKAEDSSSDLHKESREEDSALHNNIKKKESEDVQENIVEPAIPSSDEPTNEEKDYTIISSNETIPPPKIQNSESQLQEVPLKNKITPTVSIEIEHVEDILEDSSASPHDSKANNLTEGISVAEEPESIPKVEVDSLKSILINHNQEVCEQETSFETLDDNNLEVSLETQNAVSNKKTQSSDTLEKIREKRSIEDEDNVRSNSKSQDVLITESPVDQEDQKLELDGKSEIISEVEDMPKTTPNTKDDEVSGSTDKVEINKEEPLDDIVELPNHEITLNKVLEAVSENSQERMGDLPSEDKIVEHSTSSLAKECELPKVEKESKSMDDLEATKEVLGDILLSETDLSKQNIKENVEESDKPHSDDSLALENLKDKIKMMSQEEVTPIESESSETKGSSTDKTSIFSKNNSEETNNESQNVDDITERTKLKNETDLLDSHISATSSEVQDDNEDIIPNESNIQDTAASTELSVIDGEISIGKSESLKAEPQHSETEQVENQEMENEATEIGKKIPEHPDANAKDLESYKETAPINLEPEKVEDEIEELKTESKQSEEKTIPTKPVPMKAEDAKITKNSKESSDDAEDENKAVEKIIYITENVVSASFEKPPSSEKEKSTSLDEKPSSEKDKSTSLDEKPLSDKEKSTSLDENRPSEKEKSTSLDEKPSSETEVSTLFEKPPSSEKENSTSLDEKPSSEKENSTSSEKEKSTSLDKNTEEDLFQESQKVDEEMSKEKAAIAVVDLPATNKGESVNSPLDNKPSSKELQDIQDEASTDKETGEPFNLSAEKHSESETSNKRSDTPSKDIEKEDSIDHTKVIENIKTTDVDDLVLEDDSSSDPAKPGNPETETTKNIMEKEIEEAKDEDDSRQKPERNSTLLVSNQLIGTQNLPTNHIEIEKITKKLSSPSVREKDIGTLTSGRLVPTPIAELQLKSFKTPNDDGAWYDIYVEPKVTGERDLVVPPAPVETKRPDSGKEVASVVEEPMIISERAPSYYIPKEIEETVKPKPKNSVSFFVSFDSDDGKPKYKIPKRFQNQPSKDAKEEIKDIETTQSESDIDSNEEEIEIIEVSEGDPEYQQTGGTKLQTILELDNENEMTNEFNSQGQSSELNMNESNVVKPKSPTNSINEFETAYKTDILNITRSVQIIERAYKRFKNRSSLKSEPGNASDFENQNRAAIVIQKWVRNTLKQKAYDTQKSKQSLAARKIQRAYRRYVEKAKQRTQKQEMAALIIQMAFKRYSNKIRTELNKTQSSVDTELEQNNAASKIQRAYRRYLKLQSERHQDAGISVKDDSSSLKSVKLPAKAEMGNKFNSNNEHSLIPIHNQEVDDYPEIINELQPEELNDVLKKAETESNSILLSDLTKKHKEIKELRREGSQEEEDPPIVILSKVNLASVSAEVKKPLAALELPRENEEQVVETISKPINLTQLSEEPKRVKELKSDEFREIENISKVNLDQTNSTKSPDKEIEELQPMELTEKLVEIEKPSEEMKTELSNLSQASPTHPLKDDLVGKSSAALIIQRAFRQYIERRKLDHFEDSSIDSITSSRITAIETANYPAAGTPSRSLIQEAIGDAEDTSEDTSKIQPKSEWFVGSTRIIPSQGVVEGPVEVETNPDPAAIATTSKAELTTSTQVESVETVDRTHGSLESKLNPGTIIDDCLGDASEKDNAISSGLAGLAEASEARLDSVEDPLLLSQSDFGGLVQSLDIASTQELLNDFLQNEIEYSSRQGPFPSAKLLDEVIEEPCIKRTASLVNVSECESESDIASQKVENTDSSLSETAGLDTLSADTIDKATIKLSKPEEVIEKMSQLRDSKSHERISSADPSFDEPVIRPISSLQEQSSLDIEDGDIIVYNRLQRDETRESSAQSDSVVFGDAVSENNQEKELLNEEESGRVHLMRHYTIAGDDPRGLFRSVTIDDALSYVENGANGMGASSFCLDDETSENIRKKMMAYSLSETDSDYFDPKKVSSEDFEIDTAMADAMGTSTETESTIVSAATKIQAGARGFLTRRRLRRASAGTKSSTLDTKASFGNDAISESLERFIEEEAAKKIQTAYRMHTRKRKGHSRKMEGISLESNLAARRQKLQRGDALRNDSTPDDENSLIVSGVKAQRNAKTQRSKTVGEVKSSADMELMWLKMRQNSMPVQIDCEVFRVIPKHMRKRIKSAEANKRK